MSIEFKLAPPDFAAEYIRLRGLTRENAVSEDRLRSLGITAESWANDIRSNELQGFISQSGQELVGYCFGDTRSGEVVVLAVRPTHERQGVGRRLLALVVEQLGLLGHKRLFLGCSSDPKVRSYGFYRHLGWRSTGTVDERGDEVLELLRQ
jgi:ribosomal protein S18 acetylase RimI-like enzyme